MSNTTGNRRTCYAEALCFRRLALATRGKAEGVRFELTKECWPVPSPAPSKQKTPRGISENAWSVIVRNAQNSAPSKNDIPDSRDPSIFDCLSHSLFDCLLIPFRFPPRDQVGIRQICSAGGTSCATSGTGLSTKF
jgi:hypothetical protein